LWGTLLVLFDITYTSTSNGAGFRVDFISDSVGLLLITVAVGRLRHIPMDSSYATGMIFVHWVSILSLLESLMQHFVFDSPWLLTFLSSVLGIARIVAVLSFCACMRHVSREALLDDAERIWLRTLVFFFVLYGIPLGVLLTMGLVAMVTGQPPRLDPGSNIVWLGVLFLLPLLSFVSATATMARSAETMSSFSAQVTALQYSALRRR
jgi:hypothetical protein